MNDQEFIEQLIKSVTPRGNSKEGTTKTAYFKCNCYGSTYSHEYSCKIEGCMTSCYSTGEKYVSYDIYRCAYNTSRECWFEFDITSCTILDGKTSLEELNEKLDRWFNFKPSDRATFLKDLKECAYDTDENYEQLKSAANF